MKLSNKYGFLASAATIILLASGLTPAHASGNEADEVADAVTAVAPVPLAGTKVFAAKTRFRANFAEGGAVLVPVDPMSGVRLAGSGKRPAATITLPSAERLSSAVIAEDGSITFAGDADTAAVNILPSADAVRFSTVIDSAEQAESFSYDFGTRTSVEVQTDGSALVYAETGVEGEAVIETVVAIVRAPWAFDAEGTPVETKYVADGSTLTQVVNHADAEVAYPVVADPTFDSPMIFQSRVRFNRAETKTIANLGIASLGGAICGPMAWVCIGAGLVLAYNAGVAENSSPKMCTQVTLTQIPGTSPFWWVDNYRGGPCR